jgi:hypothetical protein
MIESSSVTQAVITPLLSEGYLNTILHFDVIDFGKASDVQIHDNDGSRIRSVPAGRPNSIVVYISAQNAIEDPFFFLSVIDLT